MIDIIKNLSKKTKLAIILSFVIIIVITLAIILIQFISMPRGTVTYINDPSGLIVYSTNAENEESAGQYPLVIGFDIFFEFGFSSIQQKTIYDTIQSFFAINYPSFNRVSYIKDSFQYNLNENNSVLSTFLIESDTGQRFKVDLNTNNSYKDIAISISEL